MCPYDQIQVMPFCQETTEMTLCSSQCLCLHPLCQREAPFQARGTQQRCWSSCCWHCERRYTENKLPEGEKTRVTLGKGLSCASQPHPTRQSPLESRFNLSMKGSAPHTESWGCSSFLRETPFPVTLRQCCVMVGIWPLPWQIPLFGSNLVSVLWEK